MKKVILCAIMIASLFMSIVAYAEPKAFENSEMNPDSCYVTAFYDIDSLEIKNDERIKIMLVDKNNNVLFVNHQKYIAVGLPAGDYKVYSEKEIKPVYANKD